MGLIKKKGKEGAAVTYISRNQALKKLQLSLPAFRRLCILKGIYPREPANKKKVSGGSTAPRTYYYRKDIHFLLHEPLVAQFRQHRIYQLKLKKAIAKREWALAKSIEDNLKPEFRLDHIIKERYPSFPDALRDLDDALSMILLFSTLASQDKIPSAKVLECQRLAGEWEAYVAHTHSLRRVFCSIKGVYYQADVKGMEIVWIVPHRFTQDVPTDVDFKIMSTFLDLYVSLIGFVNFKLYADAQLVYPPKQDGKKEARGAGISSYVLESTVKEVEEVEAMEEGDEVISKRQSKLKQKQVISDLSEKIASMADVEDSDDEDVEQAELKEAAIGIESVVVDGEEVAEDESKNEVPTISELEARTLSASAFTTLFSDCKIWLSREVPIHSVAFAIKSFGGSVSWIDNVGTFPANDPSITHHIIDRPAGMEDWKLEYGDTRDYVQPQWVFDCINAKRILPTTGYHAGEILPPHLSPFEVYEEGDYVPEAAESAFSASRGGSGEGMVGDVEVLDVNDVDVKIAEEDDDEPHGGPEDDDIEEVDSDEEMYQSELKAEAAGLSYSEYMQKKIEKEAGGKRKSVAAAATPSKKSKASADADEKKELSKMMMGKKDKRLYEQIQFGKDKKAVKVAALTKKRDDAKVSKGKKSGWNVVER